MDEEDPQLHLFRKCSASFFPSGEYHALSISWVTWNLKTQANDSRVLKYVQFVLHMPEKECTCDSSEIVFERIFLGNVRIHLMKKKHLIFDRQILREQEYLACMAFGLRVHDLVVFDKRVFPTVQVNPPLVSIPTQIVIVHDEKKQSCFANMTISSGKCSTTPLEPTTHYLKFYLEHKDETYIPVLTDLKNATSYVAMCIQLHITPLIEEMEHAYVLHMASHGIFVHQHLINEVTFRSMYTKIHGKGAILPENINSRPVYETSDFDPFQFATPGLFNSGSIFFGDVKAMYPTILGHPALLAPSPISSISAMYYQSLLETRDENFMRAKAVAVKSSGKLKPKSGHFYYPYPDETKQYLTSLFAIVVKMGNWMLQMILDEVIYKRDKRITLVFSHTDSICLVRCPTDNPINQDKITALCANRDLPAFKFKTWSVQSVIVINKTSHIIAFSDESIPYLIKGIKWDNLPALAKSGLGREDLEETIRSSKNLRIITQHHRYVLYKILTAIAKNFHKSGSYVVQGATDPFGNPLVVCPFSGLESRQHAPRCQCGYLY